MTNSSIIFIANLLNNNLTFLKTNTNILLFLFNARSNKRNEHLGEIV